jgi:hypothetical protein
MKNTRILLNSKIVCLYLYQVISAQNRYFRGIIDKVCGKFASSRGIQIKVRGISRETRGINSKTRGIRRQTTTLKNKVIFVMTYNTEPFRHIHYRFYSYLSYPHHLIL